MDEWQGGAQPWGVRHVLLRDAASGRFENNAIMGYTCVGGEQVNQLSNHAEECAGSDVSVSPPWSTTAKIVVIVFGVVLLGAGVLRFREVIAPLVIACLVAYVLSPIANFVTTRLGVPRGLSTGIVYLLAIGLFVLAVVLLAPLLVQQARSFQLDFQQIGAYVEEFFSRPFQVGTLSLDLAPLYDELINMLTGFVGSLASRTVTFLAGVVTIIIEIIFIGIVSFYITKDGPQMGQAMAQWVPPNLRYDATRLWKQLSTLWRAFFRGQLLLALTVGVILGVLMAILGIKNALILGLLAFFLEFLPSVGHALWLIVAVPLVWFQGSLWIPLDNIWVAAMVLGIHLIFQQVDLNILIPRIVGRQVDLHPMVVVIGIIGGGILGGVLGILLAAPTIASAFMLTAYVYRKLLDMPPWPVESDAPEEKEA
jgi:predicted PurR-regulated permease PerM